MFKSLDKLGRDLSKAVDQVGRDISKSVDENWKSTLLFGVLDKATSVVDKAINKFDRTCNDFLFGDNFLAGLLKSMGSGIMGTVDRVMSDIDQSLRANKPYGQMVDNLRTGNVVQLISRSGGRALQIVMAPTGQLVVDGLGPVGQEFLHAHWTVLNEGKNIVRLHNQNNYLAIVNGATVILQFPDPSCTSPETRFRLHQISNFVCLESVKAPRQHIGLLRDGPLKAAVATGTEMDAQFGVQLIYSPYAASAPVKK